MNIRYMIVAIILSLPLFAQPVVDEAVADGIAAPPAPNSSLQGLNVIPLRHFDSNGNVYRSYLLERQAEVNDFANITGMGITQGLPSNIFLPSGGGCGFEMTNYTVQGFANDSDAENFYDNLHPTVRATAIKVQTVTQRASQRYLVIYQTAFIVVCP